MSHDIQWQFSVRRLMVFVLFASITLFLITWAGRWINSPPEGMQIDSPTVLPPEIGQLISAFGRDELRDLQVWSLASYLWVEDFVWHAKTSPRVVEELQTIAGMQPITKEQVPAGFWKVPPQKSTMPDWWKPTATPTAEFYMSPEFPTHSYFNGDLNCCAMYDPTDGTIYVMTQFDF